jgi:hypothetical protein
VYRLANRLPRRQPGGARRRRARGRFLGRASLLFFHRANHADDGGRLRIRLGNWQTFFASCAAFHWPEKQVEYLEWDGVRAPLDRHADKLVAGQVERRGFDL